MNCHKRNIIVCLCLLVMLTTTIVTSAGCFFWGSRGIDIVIENHREQVLIVYIDNYKLGEVNPGMQVTQSTSADMGEWEIKAKSSQGEIVFSETYTFNPDDKYHLQKIKDGVYKAVIPPLENGSESSENVTLNK